MKASYESKTSPKRKSGLSTTPKEKGSEKSALKLQKSHQKLKIDSTSDMARDNGNSHDPISSIEASYLLENEGDEGMIKSPQISNFLDSLVQEYQSKIKDLNKLVKTNELEFAKKSALMEQKISNLENENLDLKNKLEKKGNQCKMLLETFSVGDQMVERRKEKVSKEIKES